MEVQDPVKMDGKCSPASCLGHLIVEGVWPDAKILKVVKLRLGRNSKMSSNFILGFTSLLCLLYQVPLEELPKFRFFGVRWACLDYYLLMYKMLSLFCNILLYA